MAVVSKADKHGRYRTPTAGAEHAFDAVAAGTIRLSVLQDLPRAMWARGIGIWWGRATGTAVTARLGMYQTNQNKEPAETADLGGDDTLMGYTESESVNTSMTSTAGGKQSELDFDSSSVTGPGTVSVLLAAGERVAVGPLPTVATLGVSYEPSENADGSENTALVYDNEHWYELLGLSQPPPADIDGYTDQGEQGVLTVWIYGEWNEAPRDPVNRTVLNLNSLTPTFQWDFRDNNGRWGGPSQNNSGSNVGDRVNRVHVQVRRKSDGQSFWSFVRTATQDERDNDQPQVLYAGTTLIRGTVYQWRVRHEDFAGAWSDFSDWLDFTVDEFGTVTLDGDPKSTIQAITAIDFDGKWTHTAALSTNAVQIRLLTQSNVVIATSAIVAKVVASSAAPGTAFVVTWAESGFVDLEWGQTYKYQIRGRDTGNNWSDYSARRQFKTNAAPTIASDLQPDGYSFSGSNLPLFSCVCTDADDDPGTGFIVTAELTFPDASTDTRAMAFNPAAGTQGRWEYQMVPGDLVVGDEFGTYSLRMRGFDGTTYSGGLSSVAAWSSPISFDYLDGPTVTITSPTEGQVVGTTSLHVAWTSSVAQRDYQDEQIVDVDTGKRVVPAPNDIFTAPVERTNQEFDVGPGVLKNGGNYAFTFTFIDTSFERWGVGPRLFSVSYTPPDDVTGLSVLTKRIGADPWDTSVLVSWDATLLGAAFGGYRVYRRPVDALEADDVLMAVLANPNDTFWYDFHPVSGIEYLYTVAQIEHKDSGEDVASAGVSSSAMVTLRGTVLTSVTDGFRRVVLYNIRERGESLNQRVATYDVVSGGAPVRVQSPTIYLSQPITAWLIENPTQGLQAADAAYQDLLELIGAPRNGPGPDVTLSGPSGTMSLRDERQRLRYVAVDLFESQDRRQPRYEVSLTLTDSRWTPKVEVR